MSLHKVVLFRNNRVNIQIQIEPRGIWVGLYWTVIKRRYWYTANIVEKLKYLHVYICLVPVIVIHINVLIQKQNIRREEGA